MATTTTPVNCPIDGCDYGGEPASVEAHISRKTDRRHKGRVGRDFELSSSPDVAGVETTSVDSGSEGRGDVEEDSTEVESGSGGRGISFLPRLSTTQLLIVVGVAVVLLWWFNKQNEEQVEEEEESVDVDDEEEQRTYNGFGGS